MRTALVLFRLSGTFAVLKFASYYGDHMVLQRGPQRAIVWGTADTVGERVTVTIHGHGHASTHVTKHPSDTGGIWKVKLPAITAHGPFRISAKSSEGEATLHDVLFGDVWICSGQSNMEFSMYNVRL